MRYLIRVTGAIVTLGLLLTVVAGAVQAHQVGPGQSGTTSVSADDIDGTEGSAWACLALVGGTALLAGGAWISRMRRMLQ